MCHTGGRESKLWVRAKFVKVRFVLGMALVIVVLGACSAIRQPSARLFAEPKIDAKCLGSPEDLATDNIPELNDRASSIIDISAVGESAHDAPLAWIYTTYDQRTWVQANLPNRAVLLEALGDSVPGMHMAAAPVFSDGTMPVRMSRQLITQMESLLKHAATSACSVFRSTCQTRLFNDSSNTRNGSAEPTANSHDPQKFALSGCHFATW